MELYLCEKPSQASDLASVLGIVKRDNGFITCRNDRVVTWAFGHLAEQFMPDDYDEGLKRWDLKPLPIVPDPWKLKIKKSGAKQFKVIKSLMKDSRRLWISTDYEREGELIARELMILCGYKGPVSRLKLQGLDETSIRRALNEPLDGSQTETLYYEGLARARADWLVGINLSRLFTLLARSAGGDTVLHIGRVITPMVSLVVDRDKSIAGFQPSPYHEMYARILVQRGQFWAKWECPDEFSDEEGRCTNKSYAQQIVSAVHGANGRIAVADKKKRTESAPLPFDLTSLQQYAGGRWGYTAQQTLDAAQMLYETYKVTSYPRTDSRYLPNSQHPDAPGILQCLSRTDPDFAGICAGADTTKKGRAFNDNKVSAHHGIIPTQKVINLDDLSERERNIYDAIRRHYVAQFYAVFEYEETQVKVEVDAGTKGQPETFTAKGRVPVAMGWKVLFKSSPTAEDKDKDSEDTGSSEFKNDSLPEMVAGEGAQSAEARLLDKMTRPSPHFTEATLLAAMENIARFVPEPQFKKILKETSGLGTPATRAGMIEGAIQKGYLRREKKTLRATDKAFGLISFVPRVVASPGMTAAWEQELQKIAAGNQSMATFMKELERWLTKMITTVRNSNVINTDVAKTAFAKDGGVTYDCPTCGSQLRKRSGQYGDFWSCTSKSCGKTFDDYRKKPDFKGSKRKQKYKKKSAGNNSTRKKAAG